MSEPSKRTCYAARLGGCEGALTREHYVSRAVLEGLGEWFIYRGSRFPDGRAMREQDTPARILCKRHNEALSPIDRAGRDLQAAFIRYHKGEGVRVVTVPGVHVERWLLKVMCGLIASGNVARVDGVAVPRELPIEWVRVLFGEPMPDGWGLYAPASTMSDRVHHDLRVAAPMTADGVIGRLQFVFYGVALELSLGRMPDGVAAYRPEALTFKPSGRINFAWPRAGARAVRVMVAPRGVERMTPAPLKVLTAALADERAKKGAP